ncbi:MAG: hypothetical protein V8R91_15530 [Butyricimonas faecihominis]
MKDWLVKAMQYEGTGLIDRINFVTMLGDTHKALKQFDKAKRLITKATWRPCKLRSKMRVVPRFR